MYDLLYYACAVSFFCDVNEMHQKVTLGVSARLEWRDPFGDVATEGPYGRCVVYVLSRRHRRLPVCRDCKDFTTASANVKDDVT
jgi:hypothetical protein